MFAPALTTGQTDAKQRPGSPIFRPRDFTPALALFIIGMLGLIIATLSPSGKGGQYAVVAPPWYNLGQSISLVQAAGGAILDKGGPANIIIVQSNNPGFVSALYRQGAWLVIDPMRLRGCVGFQPAANGESA